MVLAGGRAPRARTHLAAPDLDDVRLGRVNGGDPVEAVAAEIHEPAAVAKVSLKRVKHRPGPVLGMTAREDDAVRRQERGPYGMQVFVGDDVKRVTLDLEPIGQ